MPIVSAYPDVHYCLVLQLYKRLYYVLSDIASITLLYIYKVIGSTLVV